MARLELEHGTGVLLLETGDALLLEADPVTVTPPTIALILTTYIPIVTAINPIEVIPGTLALSLTTYIPTISTPRTVTPPTLSLTLTTYIPLIDAGLTVRPGTLALTLTTFSPGVGGVTGDIVVKIAFVSDALDASPTWVDVTSDVLTMYIRRGRQLELDRFEAGRATIVLDNQDGDYWPDNGGSPYTGNIKLRKRLSISKLSSGIVYDLYTGFIDDWKPGWRGIGGKGPTMTLGCSDLIKIMSRMPMNDVSESEELSGTRIGNILDTVGWPGADRTLDTGKDLMRATGTFTDEKAMAHIQAVCKSEISNFFIAPSGYAVYEDRSHRASPPHDTSQATFGNDKGAGELPFIDIEFSMDDKLLINEARGTRVSGTEQTSTDATSITNHGLSGVNDSGLLLVDDINVDVRNLYLIARFADVAGMRVKSLTFLPQADPANLWPKALGYDISTRITINLDQASVSRDYFIEGIEHRWNANEVKWTTKWKLSEASRYLFPTFPARDQDISPDASGDETNINNAATGDPHWSQVVDGGTSTYVENTDNDSSFDTDLYNLEAPAYSQGTINKITVTVHCFQEAWTITAGQIKIAIKSGTTVAEGSVETPSYATYEVFTKEWAVNPDTSSAWTWSEINSLQVGIAMEAPTMSGPVPGWIRCKFIEVNINFTPTWA